MATATNSEINKAQLEDLLQCMICFESYQTPKMLNCGHTFCAECLMGYHRTYQQQKRAVPGKLPCPTCRELTGLPANGISGLRNDFKVKKIEEMFKTVSFKYRGSSHNCDSCRSQKKNTQARVYCASCAMNYCEICLKRHNKNPLFKKHQVLDKSKENTSELSCKTHAGEQGKFFCRTCEVVVCTLCIMNGHDDHTIKEIEDVFRQHSQDINNLKNIVETRMSNLKRRASDLETMRQANLKACQQAEIDIKEKAKQTLDIIRKHEAELLEELRKKRDTKLEQVSKELDRVNFHVAKAFSLSEFAKNTVSRNSLRMMALHEELIQRMRTVAQADNGDDDSQVTVITFLPNRHEASLGRIDEARGNASDFTRGELAPTSPNNRRRVTPALHQAHGEVHPRPSLLLHAHRYGNKPGELRDPLGVACLLNGDIVVSEWGNKRIQLFDSVAKPIHMIGAGQMAPQGVAVTLKGNIIATDGQQKRLQVFTPSGNTLARWGLGKFFGPCGVAISPNGNCIVSDAAEHSVSIYRGEKTCVKRFGSRGKRDDQFDHPLYVATGQHNEIIVSDSDNHCIKVFDSSGQFVRKFGGRGSADGQMIFPRGVVMDQHGHIIVSDRNNDRISLFTIQGRFVRHLLTKNDGIKDPYGLAISIAGNLVVTESAENRAALKMFQL